MYKNCCQERNWIHYEDNSNPPLSCHILQTTLIMIYDMRVIHIPDNTDNDYQNESDT